MTHNSIAAAGAVDRELIYLYRNPDRSLGAWEELERLEIPKTGPRTHFEPVPEPIQGQLDVQGHPTPPFQSQLDVQRLLEPPFQGQPDVQGSLKPSHFQCFLRFQRDPQRKGPNLCFCRQARYFRGFADFAKTPKIDKKTFQD